MTDSIPPKPPVPDLPSDVAKGAPAPGPGQPPRSEGPADGAVRVRYKRAALVKVLIVDTDFVLVFADGRKILIKDGALRATLEQDYRIVFADEEVPAGSLFGQAETAEASTDAVTLGGLIDDALPPTLDSAEQVVALAPVATTVTVKAAASGISTLGAVGGAVTAAGLAAGGGAGAGAGAGGGAAGGTAATGGASVAITGMKGPFVTDNRVEVFDLAGNRLATGRLTDSQVTLNLPEGYRGLVMVRIHPSGTDQDYVDEKTLKPTKLVSDFGLRAFVLIEPGVGNKVTVSPLTELAVRDVLEDRPAPTAEKPVVLDEAKKANVNVGLLVGLGDITGPVVPTIKPDGTVNPAFTGDDTVAAQLYGKILAQLSGLASGGVNLEGLLSALEPMVEQVRVAVAAGNKTDEAAAKASVLDQLSAGAKRVSEAVRPTDSKLADVLAKVSAQTQRVLLAPAEVIQNGIKAEQESSAELRDGCLNAAERGTSIELPVGLPGQVKAGDQITLKWILVSGSTQSSSEIILTREITQAESTASKAVLTVPKEVWANLGDGSSVRLEVTVSAQGLSSVSYPAFLAKSSSNKEGATLTLDFSAPSVPAGDLSIQSQVKQADAAARVTGQQTPIFSGNFDAKEQGAVLVFHIKSEDGRYEHTWRSDVAGSPIVIDTQAGRWGLTIPASAKLPIAPDGIAYQARAQLTDVAGNASAWADLPLVKAVLNASLTLDPSSDTATQGDNLTSQAQPLLSGKTPAGIAKVEVVLDGETYSSAEPADSAKAIALFASGEFTFTPIRPLADKTYTPQVRLFASLSATAPLYEFDGSPITIDTTRPTVALSLSSGYSSSLKVGESVELMLSFSEAVQGLSLADITVPTGRVSNLVQSSADPKVYTVTYTPAQNLAAQSVQLRIGSGTFTDLAGNANTDGADTNNAVSLNVDTQAPTITGVAITSDAGADGSYKAGDTITFSVTFSEAVSFSDSGVGLNLRIGNVIVTATSDSGNTASGTVKTFSYAVQPGDTDTGGISIAANPVVITGSTTTIVDAAGNNAVLAYASITEDSASHKIDTTAPTLSISASRAAINAEAVSNTSTITFTFSEDPGTSFGWDGTQGDITVTGGTLGALSNKISNGNGTFSYTATFSPQANFEGQASITVGSQKFSDLTGNLNTAGGSQTLEIDTQAPTVSLSAKGGVSALKAGQSATVVLSFSETPVGLATDDLSITGGTLLALVPTADAKVWEAIVSPNAGSNANLTVSLGGDQFTDRAGNKNAFDAADAVTFTVDTVLPVVAVSAGGVSALKAGESATITFTFSEDPGSSFAWDAVLQTGDITVTGGTLGALSAKQGTGTQADPFRYTATFTPNANSTVAGSVSVGNGVFTDLAQNANADGDETNNRLSFAIDTVRPTVSIQSGSLSTLKAGETTVVTFVFSEDPGSSFTWDAVAQSGDIAVSGGTLSALTGTGLIRTATFTPAADGQGTATLSVATDKFQDAAGNLNQDGGDANNTLALPYDTERPTVALSSDPANLSTLKKDATATVTFTFNKAPGESFGLEDVQVVGGALSSLQVVGGTDGKQYTATFTPQERFTGTATLTVDNNRFQDAVGNFNQDGTDANNKLSFNVDTQPPTASLSASRVSLNAESGSNTSTITFTFSEDPGTSFGWDGTQGELSVTGGTLSALSSKISNGNGTFSYTATFTPDPDRATDATVSIAAGKFTDSAGNLNNRSAQLALRVDTVAPKLPQGQLHADSDTGFDLATRSDGITKQLNPRLSGSAQANANLTATIDLGGGKTWVGSTRTDDTGRWDLTVATNLTEGTYTPQLVVVTDSGNRSTGSASPFTVDLTKPDALGIGGEVSADLSNDTGISLTDGVTQNPTPLLNGTAEAHARVQVQLSGRSYLTTASDKGTWEIKIPEGLPDSTYVPVITVTDSAGNSTEKAGTAFRIDTQLTVATTAYLEAASDTGIKGDGRTSQTQPQFSGTAESGSTVEFTIDGKTYQTLAENGFWTIKVGGAPHAGHALLQGSYAYSVKATDAAGNTQTISYTGNSALLIQTQIPDPSLSLTRDTGHGDSGTDSDRLTSDTRLSVSDLAADASQVQFKITNSQSGSTDWLSESAYNAAMLSRADGQYTVHVRQISSTGVTSEGNSSITFTKDTAGEPINVQLLNDTGNGEAGTTADRRTNDPRLSISGQETGALLQYSIDGAKTWTSSYAPATDNRESIETVFVRQIDRAGNIGPANVLLYTLDTAAPLSSAITGAPDERGSLGKPPVYGGLAEPSAMVEVTFTSVTSARSVTLKTVASLSGQWSVQPGEDLAIARHTVKLKVTDAAGNATVIDGQDLPETVPKLTITSDKSQLLPGQTATITFTFSQDPGISFERSDVSVRGGSLGALSDKKDNGDGTYSYTATFNPTANTASAVASITVAAGSYQDASNKNGLAGTTPRISINTLAVPTIDNIAGEDSSISVGELGASISGTCIAGASAVNVVLTNRSTGASITKTATISNSTTWATSALTAAEIATLGGGGSSVVVTARQTVGGAVSSPASRTLTIADDFTTNQASIQAFTINATLAGDNIISNNANDGIIRGTATTGATVTVTLTNPVTGASVTLAPVTAANNVWTTVTLNAAQLAALGGDGQPLMVSATQLFPSTAGINANKSSTITRTIAIDTVAPTAPGTPALVAASDTNVAGDNITSATTPSFTGIARPGATVRLYRDGVQTGSSTTADAKTGEWTIAASTLTTGTHNITARQTDFAGNESAASGAVAVTVDTRADGQIRYLTLVRTSWSGVFQNIQETSVYTDDGQKLNLAQLGASALSSVGSATGLIDGLLGNTYIGNPGSFVWARIDLNGFYRVSQVDVVVASDNPDRSHDYRVFGSISDTVTGSSLNYGASNLPDNDSRLMYLGVVNATTPGQTVVFNQGFQTFGVLTITPAQSVAGQPTLTGTGEAGATVEITDTVNGTATVLGTAKVNGAGLWSFFASTITSGTHHITVKQTDLAGNTQTLSSGYTFTVNNNLMGLPALASATDSAALGDGITHVAAPTLTGSGVGASAVVEIFDGSTKLGETTAVGGSWTFTPSLILSAGLHNITARSGGVTSSIFSLTIDTAAAAPLITTPVAANVQRAPTLRGTGVEAYATITLTVRATDGSATQSFTATANASGAWAIDTANPPVHPTSNQNQTALAANKVWVFSATQTDLAGNTSPASAPQTVNFDTSIATPTLSNLADNATTGSRLTVAGTGEASNLLGNVTVRVYDGSTLLGSTTTDFMGGWTFTTPALSTGARTLRVEQIDAVGNLSAQLSKPITVSTTALGAPLLSADGLRIANTPNGNNRLTPSSPFEVTAAGGSAVSFWAKLDSSNDFANLNAQLVSGNGLANYELYFKNGSLFLWRGAELLVNGFTPDTNWHQYVISHDGSGNASLYIDGVHRFTPGGSSTTFTNLSLTFGSHGDPNNRNNLNGLMRDIKVWDVSLSQTQVTALLQGQSTGQESQIKAAYALLGDTTATTGPALTVTGTMTANAADTGILGDNITNSKVFSLTGQAAPNATIEIWDSAANGNSFFVQRVVADSTGAWRANLDNQSEGAHNYVARQLNTNGSTTDSAATTITIDTIAPSAPSTPSLSVASNSGSTSDTITNINTPTLSGTANAFAWVTVLQGGSAVGKVQAGANGDWTFTVPRAVADGSYSYTARQEDAAGNLSAVSSALSVTVDTTVAATGITVAGQVRFVLLKQTGVNQIQQHMWVNEVEVYANGTNVALGKTATAGGTSVARYPASAVTNGSLLRDNNNGYASNAASTDNWIQIDLGGFFSIEQVRVFALSSAAGDVSNVANIDIFGSASALSSFTYAQLAAGSGGAIRVGGTGAQPVYTTALSTPAWQTGVGVSAQPLITGQGEAGSTVEITDTVNGIPTLLGTVRVNSSGVWSFQATSITSGTHSITTRQTDVAGNVSAWSNPYVFSITAAPVVIDLNRDGVLSYSQAVIDVNRDGQLDHSAWVAPQDGVLVWDKFHDGKVHDASQYVFSQGQGQTDLQGLAAQFDTHRDGVFDAKDALFAEFAVWQDRNQNGVSDTGEVRSLAYVGLTAIRLQSDGMARQTAPGVHEAGRSSATASDGSSVLVGDVGFAFTSVAATSAKQGQINLATDISANLLQLTLQDLLALPTETLFDATNTRLLSGTPLQPAQRQLMVTGNSHDVVKIDPTLLTDTQTVVRYNDHSYQVYTVDSAQTQLLIDHNIVNAGRVL